MGSHAAQTYRDRTKAQNWHTISADSVSWANVTTLIVSPKLGRLLVIRGKYLITSGLPLPSCFTTQTPSHGGGTAGKNLRTPFDRKAESRQPTAFSWMKSSASQV